MANAKITDDEFLKLLAEYEYNFKKGDLLKGTVIAFTSEGAIVDIGAKSAAICPEYEIKISKTDNVEDIIKIGETYEFLITEEEDDEDRFTLSYKKVAIAYNWKKLEEIKEKDEIV
ncbi:S1 RNA-binding domain-containing protein, partial [bacterium]|nr:S1 RNA-binding domain-containing protein [bacterium]